jgi:DHA1 family bicyclomycin/chloramphenicol resistance-like MFS transporter
MVASHMLGSYITGRMTAMMDASFCLGCGIATTLTGADSIVWLVQSGFRSPLALTTGMCLIFFGSGIVSAIAPTKALDAITIRAGYASSLVGYAELGLGGLTAALVTVLHEGTSMPLASALLGLAIVAGSLFCLLRRRPALPLRKSGR